jgi:hypothetical protein
MKTNFNLAGSVAAAKLFTLSLAAALFIAHAFVPRASGQEAAPPKPLDPAAWGGNHVGKPLPEFVHGDECLFCHRNTIGVTWQKNAHGVTVRQREDAVEFKDLLKDHAALAALDKEVEYVLGSRHFVRLLKKNGYGKFAILNAQAVLNGEAVPPQAAKWRDAEKPAWDKDKFAQRCAGCHTTAVDAETKSFAAFGLDCYTCHGEVNLEHSKDTSIILLSKKNKTDKQVVTSLCAQCHLREGKSKTTGLPYANHFVAGDNLFQDFVVDWKKADDPNLNPGDRHVWKNVRDVALNNSDLTCLSCHQIHANSSRRHRVVLKGPICFECHSNEEGKFKEVRKYEVKSALCEYYSFQEKENHEETKKNEDFSTSFRKRKK